MNRYVVVVREEYDQYEVKVPHPLTSPLPKQQLQQELSVIAKDLAGRPSQQWLTTINFHGISISVASFVEFGSDGFSPYPPQMLTLDEWFTGD